MKAQRAVLESPRVRILRKFGAPPRFRRIWTKRAHRLLHERPHSADLSQFFEEAETQVVLARFLRSELDERV